MPNRVVSLISQNVRRLNLIRMYSLSIRELQDLIESKELDSNYILIKHQVLLTTFKIHKADIQYGINETFVVIFTVEEYDNREVKPSPPKKKRHKESFYYYDYNTTWVVMHKNIYEELFI
jgi:hypothetical protein